LPNKQVCLTITDQSDEHKIEWCGATLADIPNPVRWDGVFDDGTRAQPGIYTAIVRVWDILDRMAEATGRIIVPEPTPVPSPTATPTATAVPTQPQSQPPVSVPGRVQPTPTGTASVPVTPTLTPTATPTATATAAPEKGGEATPEPVPTKTVTTIVVTATAKAVRSVWTFVTLIGLAVVLGFSALRDERPQAIHRLAERMNDILNLRKEEK